MCHSGCPFGLHGCMSQLNALWPSWRKAMHYAWLSSHAISTFNVCVCACVGVHEELWLFCAEYEWLRSLPDWKSDGDTTVSPFEVDSRQVPWNCLVTTLQSSWSWLVSGCDVALLLLICFMIVGVLGLLLLWGETSEDTEHGWMVDWKRTVYGLMESGKWTDWWLM